MSRTVQQSEYFFDTAAECLRDGTWSAEGFTYYLFLVLARHGSPSSAAVSDAKHHNSAEAGLTDTASLSFFKYFSTDSRTRLSS